MAIIINNEHTTLGFVFGYEPSAMKASELKDFINKNIRQKSEKTGNPVKVNTFNMKVAEMRELVDWYLNTCYNKCNL